jgi:hypothetical protein
MLIHKLISYTAVTVLAGVWWIAPPDAFAQSETDVGEVAALGGGSLGTGANPVVMGSAGIAFSRYGMALFDLSFMPLGQHTIQPWPARSTVTRSYLYDFGVDFHVRVPVGERWAPYGIVGTGLLWNIIHQDTVDSYGLALGKRFYQFNGALHTGGGVRYYVRKGWGIRSEVRVVVSKEVYTQLLAGIFYVTPSTWP